MAARRRSRAGRQVELFEPGQEREQEPKKRGARKAAPKGREDDLVHGVRAARVDEGQLAASLAALGVEVAADAPLEDRIGALVDHFLRGPEPADGYDECERCGGTQNLELTREHFGEVCAYCADGREEPAESIAEAVRQCADSQPPAATGNSTGHHVETVELTRLHLTAQSRVGLSDDAVAEYAEAMRSGAELPPVVVFRDPGTGALYLADGYHRAAAAGRAGTGQLPAEVREGTERDALLHSCGSNAEHGLRRTREDKRRAVGLLVADEEWSARSDRWIAEVCRVSRSLVAEVRSGTQTGPREGQDGVVRQPPRRTRAQREAELEHVAAEAAASADPDKVTVVVAMKRETLQLTRNKAEAELPNGVRVTYAVRMKAGKPHELVIERSREGADT